MSELRVPFHRLPDRVRAAAVDAVFEGMMARTSRQVYDVVGQFAGGRVNIFGEIVQVNGVRGINHGAQRTEIRMGNNLVVVHRNFNQARGIFATEPRFSEVEIHRDEESHSLRLVIDPTYPFNPYYQCMDGAGQVGQVRGQKMDLRLASVLLGENVGSEDAFVSNSVTEWIRERLA